MSIVPTKLDAGLFSRTETGTLVTEASTVGFPAGQWPLLIEVNGVVYTRNFRMDHHGEFSGFEYDSAEGKRVRIYND